MTALALAIAPAPRRGPRAKTPAKRVFDKAVGARLRAIRLARDLTLLDVADGVGVSRQNVIHYEAGRCSIDLFRASLLARALSCRIDDFLDAPIEVPGPGPLADLLAHAGLAATIARLAPGHRKAAETMIRALAASEREEGR